MSISSDLYTRLQSTLLHCGPFYSDRELRAVFVDARISLWRELLPEVDNPAGRVRTVIDLLRDKRSAAKQNGLILLLRVLAEQTDYADACHHDLTALAEALESHVAVSGALEFPIADSEVVDAYRVVYHNLPQSNYGRFIGREEELGKIARILRPYPHSQHAIVTIDGIGGIGKSALALEIAHRYLRNYAQIPPEERFEAIIWTSAKQSVLTAEGIKMRRQVLRTLKDIYTTIAVCLEREDITRARAEEQDELVRKALTRQRTLLVVDNLETVDDEAVLDFIREIPAPTKVMVTTRHRIDVAYPVRLMGMPEQDGLALIAQECQKKAVRLTMEQSQRLCKRTGGVPLAIAWSIALMGYGHKVDAVLRRLGEPQADISRFCFEETIARIRGTPAYRLMLALAFFVTDAGCVALGHVANLPELDRDDGLAMLERLSLLNKERERYKFLPLTKTFALAELNQDTNFKEMLRRYFDYWRNLYASTHSEYYWRYSGYSLYEEGENILGAVTWAHNNGNLEDFFELTLVSIFYLEAKGRWGEMLRMCDTALQVAKSAHHVIYIARLADSLGWILVQRGENQHAKEMFTEALKCYQEKNIQEGICITLQHLSTVYRKTFAYDEARALCVQAERIARDLESGDLLALVRTEHGKLARDMEDWQLADQLFMNVHHWFENRAEASPRDEWLAWGNWGHLAVVAYHLGRFQQAKTLCLRSLEFFEEHGTRGYLATLKYRLALAEEALGEKEAARGDVEEALKWFDHLGMKLDYDEARILFERL